MSQLCLNIELSESSLKSLRDQHYKLVVFKGITSSANKIEPTVWQVIDTNRLNEEMYIEWDTQQFVGFTSHEEVRPGVKIRSSASRNMSLGETFVIKPDGGVSVSHEGTTGTLHFDNRGNAVTIGVRNNRDKKQGAIFAAELSGKGTAKFAPREKVLVSFTSNGNLSPNVCALELSTTSATVEYFGDTDEHYITFDFDSGKWSPVERDFNYANVGISWFKWLPRAANIVKEIVNKF